MKLSIRIWQTALFILVALVGILFLYFAILPSLKESVATVAQSHLEASLANLARHIEHDFVGPDGKDAIVKETEEFIEDFKTDMWIYDANGGRILSQQSTTHPGDLLSDIVRKGLKGEKVSSADLDKRLVIASKPVVSDGKVVGLIVLADNGAEALDSLHVAQNGLKITLFIALIISSVLGFIFSEAIAREVRKLKRSASAIAQGNFDLRLKPGWVPDEVAELAETFNVMAEKLGDAFEAVRSQQKQILTVINTMAEGVLEVGTNRIVNLANPAAAELLNQPVEDLIGSQLSTVILHPSITESIDQALTGQEASQVCEYDRKILLLHGTPIKDPRNGNVGGAVLILRDFTQQKKVERAQRDFISNASHELRTPIASLKGYVELLASGAKDKPEVRDSFIKTMQVEVEHLHRLVEDLFTLASLDSGAGVLNLAEHTVGEIIQEVLAVSSPLADSVEVKLQTDIDNLASKIICDQSRIAQVMLGFVDNALKHTGAGGEITIFAHPNQEKIEMGVADTGSGIAPEMINRIFDRFYRYSTKRSERKGAGLGLSIAKEIVEAHGSKVKAKSTPGEGSTFSFTLKIPF